jgi:hypothetical protein
MPEGAHVSAPGRVVLRGVGYGVVCGAALGVASVAVLLLVAYPSELGFVVVCAPYAALVGGVVGAFVGLFGGLVVVVVGAAMPGNERLARPVAGVAAAVPIFVLAMWTFSVRSGADPWVLSGWLWWLVVAVMSGAAGAAVGPRVVGGRRDRLPARRDNRQGCALGCTLLG